jgi:hypothetical protein
MTLTWVVAGWGAVALLFLAWDEAGRLLRHEPASARAPVSAAVLEALLFTLFSALWFGSLGSGGWVLLFALLGALVELPPRLRNRESAGGWKHAVGGVARMVVAGGVLRVVLG